MSVTTGDWQGYPFPPEVVASLFSKLLTGSPFAQALSPMPTDSGHVVWPLASPTGAAWVGEAQPIPAADLGDDVYTVAVCKLATIISISNESLADASFNIGNAIGRVLADSCGPIIDEGFLYGAGGDCSSGLVAIAEDAPDAEDFRQACIRAWGSLANAGAPTTSIVVFANPEPLAEEWGRVDINGQPIHANAPAGQPLLLGPGLRVVGVPVLKPEHILAVDTSMTFLVQREQVDFDISPYPGWGNDTASLRVKGRLTVACPVPHKALRSVTVTEAAPEAAATRPRRPAPAAG